MSSRELSIDYRFGVQVVNRIYCGTRHQNMISYCLGKHILAPLDDKSNAAVTVNSNRVNLCQIIESQEVYERSIACMHAKVLHMAFLSHRTSITFMVMPYNLAGIPTDYYIAPFHQNDSSSPHTSISNSRLIHSPIVIM